MGATREYLGAKPLFFAPMLHVTERYHNIGRYNYSYYFCLLKKILNTLHNYVFLKISNLISNSKYGVELFARRKEERIRTERYERT